MDFLPFYRIIFASSTRVHFYPLEFQSLMHSLRSYMLSQDMERAITRDLVMHILEFYVPLLKAVTFEAELDWLANFCFLAHSILWPFFPQLPLIFCYLF